MGSPPVSGPVGIVGGWGLGFSGRSKRPWLFAASEPTNRKAARRSFIFFIGEPPWVRSWFLRWSCEERLLRSVASPLECFVGAYSFDETGSGSIPILDRP